MWTCAARRVSGAQKASVKRADEPHFGRILRPLTHLHIMKEGKRAATGGHGNGWLTQRVPGGPEKCQQRPRRGQREKVTPTWTVVPAGRPDQMEIRGMGGAASADPFGAREERVIRPIDSGNR